MITIRPVMNENDLGDFVRAPYHIYKYDENWVAPLRKDDFNKLDRKKNPFFEHAEAELFVARKGRNAVGRIAAILDRNFEEYHGEKVAYWGWFECENDRAMSNALFDSAVEWAEKQGATRIIGPLSPSANDVAGLLVDGFGSPPVLMMAYNPPHYADLVERYGHKKWKDLYAWLLDDPDIPERLEKIIPRVEARGRFTIRNLNMKDWDNEVARARIIYNEFEQVNSIYTPMTPAEFQQLGKDLKLIVDPDLVFFAEVDGEPIGLSITVPDFNVALKPARGRLFPIGLFKILKAKKNITRARVITMGVIEGFRNRGIALAFYYKTYKTGVTKGFTSAELSWVDEDNHAMNNTAAKLGAKRYKTYRIYEYKLRG
ncbi:MAG TPA: N-acetyltransferase [candidate division Zixibacteria bacterium]|nr:N-acetyltransferase [candidate division Zixibacteria bacterium]